METNRENKNPMSEIEKRLVAEVMRKVNKSIVEANVNYVHTKSGNVIKVITPNEEYKKQKMRFVNTSEALKIYNGEDFMAFLKKDGRIVIIWNNYDVIIEVTPFKAKINRIKLYRGRNTCK